MNQDIGKNNNIIISFSDDSSLFNQSIIYLDLDMCRYLKYDMFQEGSGLGFFYYSQQVIIQRRNLSQL